MTDRVLFQMLGPLRAGTERGPVDIGGDRARVVLAALLLEPGRVVPVGRLVEAVWDERPPASARTQIAIAVSGLRRAFRDAGCARQVIETVRPGYRIPPGAGTIDALEAEREVLRAREAARAGRREEAARRFRAALARWDGPVLAGLDRVAISAGALRWEELRLAAVEEAAEVELALGRHHELVGALLGPVAAHPYRERLRAMLMTALARAGRQSEALGVYRDGRRVLAEELGLEPGRELRGLHEAILRDDPAVYARDVPNFPNIPNAPEPARPAPAKRSGRTGRCAGTGRRGRGTGGPRRPARPYH